MPSARSGALGGAIAAAGIAALGLLIQLPLHDRSIIPMDEGHLAAVADWILDGRLLYRDIYTGIFPGIYYLTALLFEVFGRDLLVTRAAQVLVNLTIAGLLWRIAARCASAPWSALAPLLYLGLVVMSFPVLTMFNYSPLSASFGLGALLFALRYQESARSRDGVALGLLIAGSALAKQNFGGLVLIATLASLAWGRSRSALAARSWPRLLAPVLASGALVALATAAALAASGTLDDLLEATLLGLGGAQLRYFDNPIPPIFGAHPADDVRFVFLYTPPTLFNTLVKGELFMGVPVTPWVLQASTRLSYGLPLLALAALPIVLALDRRRAEQDAARATRSLALYAWIFFLGIFPSAIWSHLAFVLPPILIAFAVIADRIDAALRRRWRPGALVFRGATAAVLGLVAVIVVDTISDVRRWFPQPLDLPRAHLRVSREQAAHHRGAVAFLERCAAPGEPIFAAPDIPILYFLTKRPNPTRFDLEIPGNVDGPLIARTLESERVRCAVYNPRMYPEFPPFEELYPVLSRTLESQYVLDARIGSGDAAWMGLVRRRPSP